MKSSKSVARQRWLMAWAVVMLASLSLLVVSKYGIRVTGKGFEFSDRIIDLHIVDEGSGPMIVLRKAGERQEISPQEFIAEVHHQQAQRTERGFLYKLLDITSWTGMLWVGFGLLAQCLFMSRMIVQWLTSERAGKSVVPESFWWLSLIGSSMLMIYFTWRIEIVGFIGQSTGWLVYARNLWLLGREDAVVPDEPVAEGEVAEVNEAKDHG
ncbi:lipid-A-disaccharide synthase N-terminal domain-containing protein [Mucisphaera calidilacus]|uniref:Lipid-A-disaccharide synthase n=1 Tax=Mucisphaera calidilacus TaxID=2527982 RepID=A0A518BZN8_9BACT|nr:lipid-A-disaccharide synthase N-terminal domain-containing protein [Mucisphaera calidilacus]QDU72438.1 lipid-A-disaccharide synthase [Mucisphaera calidilacus]